VDFNRVALLEQNLVQQQDLLVQARAEVALGLIEVYRALGGGWEIRIEGCDPHPPGPTTIPHGPVELLPPPKQEQPPAKEEKAAQTEWSDAILPASHTEKKDPKQMERVAEEHPDELP
jgi:hypothetical protein